MKINITLKEIIQIILIIASFLTLAAVSQIDWAYYQNPNDDFALRMIIALITGSLAGTGYVAIIQNFSGFIHFINKFIAIKSSGALGRFIGLSSSERLTKIAIIHTPLFLLWLFIFNLEIPMVGPLNGHLKILIPVFILFLFLKQFSKLSLSGINSFFGISHSKDGMSRRSKLFLIAGGSFLMLIFSVLFISAVVLILGFSLSKFIIPASFVFAIIFTWIALRKSSGENYVKNFTVIVCLLVGSFALFAFIGSEIYNFGFDSQGYHSEIMIQMKHGWNPYHETIKDGDYDYVERNPLQTDLLNCFSRGSEIIAAAAFVFFDSYEAAKVFQFIFMIAAFFITAAALMNFTKIPFKITLLLAAALAANPVAIRESFSFYVDGQIASILLIIAALGVILFFYDDYFILILMGAAIITGVNLKFTAPLYVIILIAGIFFGYLIFDRGRLDIKKPALAAACFLIGILFVGYNPYVTNVINHGSPFYPLLSTKGDKPDNIQVDNVNEKENKKIYEIKKSHNTGLNPKIIARHQQLNVDNFFKRIRFLYQSLFSEIKYGDMSYVRIKYPFVILNRELPFLYFPATTNLSGFGPLFSGVILLSLFLLLFSSIISVRKFLTAIIIITCILISVLITSKGVYARYAPQLWLVPFVIIPLGFYINGKFFRVLSFIIFITLSVNIMYTTLPFLKGQYYATKGFKLKFEELSRADKVHKICFYPKIRSTYKIRFKDMGIKFEHVEYINKKQADIYINRFDFGPSYEYYMSQNRK